jgi:hypothetical protein
VLAPAQPLKKLCLFIAALRRNDQGDRLTNGFAGGVTEDAFGALVPGGNNAVEVLADYRVI